MRDVENKLISKKKSGQYMVEFGLTFIFFIFIILAVINLMLIAYNFNLGQRATWEAARLAAIGASNSNVATVIYDRFASQFFASPFMVSAIDFDTETFITPNNQFERIEGTEIEVNIGYRTGFSFLAMSAIEGTFPIRSRLYVIQRNDNDRDGFYDTVTANAKADSRQSDHDNDAIADSSDPDWDNDGRTNLTDTGILLYNGAAYTLDTGVGAKVVTKLSDGKFCARIIHILSDGSYDSGPYPFRPQKIPRTYSGYIPIPIMVDLSYDKNNNGWEDRYDN